MEEPLHHSLPYGRPGRPWMRDGVPHLVRQPCAGVRAGLLLGVCPDSSQRALRVAYESAAGSRDERWSHAGMFFQMSVTVTSDTNMIEPSSPCRIRNHYKNSEAYKSRQIPGSLFGRARRHRSRSVHLSMVSCIPSVRRNAKIQAWSESSRCQLIH